MFPSLSSEESTTPNASERRLFFFTQKPVSGESSPIILADDIPDRDERISPRRIGRKCTRRRVKEAATNLPPQQAPAASINLPSNSNILPPQRRRRARAAATNPPPSPSNSSPSPPPSSPAPARRPFPPPDLRSVTLDELHDRRRCRSRPNLHERLNEIFVESRHNADERQRSQETHISQCKKDIFENTAKAQKSTEEVLRKEMRKEIGDMRTKVDRIYEVIVKRRREDGEEEREDEQQDDDDDSASGDGGRPGQEESPPDSDNTDEHSMTRKRDEKKSDRGAGDKTRRTEKDTEGIERRVEEMEYGNAGHSSDRWIEPVMEMMCLPSIEMADSADHPPNIATTVVADNRSIPSGSFSA